MKQIRAVTLESEMAQILNTLVVPNDLIEPIMAKARQLAGEHQPPPDVRDAAQETFLRQLKQAYNAGILTRTEYERKLRDAETKKDHTPGGVAFHVQRALQRLADIPQLIEDATPQERLALVKSLFDRVIVENRRITELMPRADVGPVLAALVRVLDGVPDGDRTHSLLIHSQAL